MPHPLALQLAPLIHRDVVELQAIVAHWVINEHDDFERARYRTFGADLRSLQQRISKRSVPPSAEEVEIALTAMLALAGRRLRDVHA